MESEIKKLTPDALLYVALELDLPDLIQFCKSSSRINNQLCNKDKIWLEKLKRDFPDYSKLVNGPKNLKDLYILLWNLRDFKNQLNLKEDIYTLYSLKELNLESSYLTKLPSSVQFLTNLQKLDIKFNYIKELPNHFPNSLLKLHVDYNQLENLPDHLPNFLQELNVRNNKLEELPDRLPNSLQYLNVSYNQLKELPGRLPNSLKELRVYSNQLKKSEINRIKNLYPHLTIFINYKNLL